MAYESLSQVTGNNDLYTNLFDAHSGNCVLLRVDVPRYTIVAVTAAYATLTGIKKKILLVMAFNVFTRLHARIQGKRYWSPDRS